MSYVPFSPTGLAEPISFSVKKDGEGFERFRGIDNGNIIFEAATDGVLATYRIKAVGANGCTAESSFFLPCSSGGGGNPNPDPTCNKPLDLLITIDESLSIIPSDYTVMKEGVKNIINNLKTYLDSDLLRIGISTFGANSTSVCARTITTVTADYNNLINLVNLMGHGKGNTPMASGLKLANELVNGTNSRSVPKKIILITDGAPNCLENCQLANNLYDANVAAANRAIAIRNTGVEIITVAVGSGANRPFLESNICSPGSSFSATSFTEFAAISSSISTKMCQ